MEQQKNNPAGRLLWIIGQLKGRGSGQLLPALCEILEIAPASNEVRLQVGSAFYRIPSDVQRGLHLIGLQNIDSYMGWTDKFYNSVTREAGTDTKQLVSDFEKREVRALLEVCDSVLRKDAPECLVDPDQLIELRANVNSLIDEILGNSERGPLHSFILRKLFEIQTAILEYPIRGIYSLHVVMLGTIGELGPNPDMMNDIKEEPSGLDFLGILGKLGMLIKFANDGFKLLDNLRDSGVIPPNGGG